LVRDRLGAVIDQEDEAQGETQQADKPENKTDHGVLSPEKYASSIYRIPCSPLWFNYCRRGQPVAVDELGIAPA
jgi:hypothetical protein